MISVIIGIIFYSFVAIFTIRFSFKQIKNGLKKNQTKRYNKRGTSSFDSSDPYYSVLQFSKIIYFNLQYLIQPATKRNFLCSSFFATFCHHHHGDKELIYMVC
ncbi:hypothetical protein SAMN04488688_107143 [Paenibacillus sp. cl141a]|nr:hypothetical protein SAMN04488688_107143 [Paenibacillus sp. cl141a]